MILSDVEKRKIYDETGDIDGDEMLSSGFEDWYQYFRNLFPKVTVQDIEKFSSSYKGSEEEKNDIIEAYYSRNGNFREMMEFVMLAEDEDENRIANIINTGIANGDVELLPAYKKTHDKTSTQTGPGRAKRRKKAESSGQQEASDLDALTAMIRGRSEGRGSSVIGSIMAKYGGEGSLADYDMSDAEFNRAQAALGAPRSTNTKAKKKSKKGR